MINQLTTRKGLRTLAQIGADILALEQGSKACSTKS